MSKQIKISAGQSTAKGARTPHNINKDGADVGASSVNAKANSVLGALRSLLVVVDLENQLLQANLDLAAAAERIEELEASIQPTAADLAATPEELGGEAS